MLAVFCLVGCEREIVTEQLAGASMGTTWHVTLVEPSEAVSLDSLQQGIENQLEAVDQSMST